MTGAATAAVPTAHTLRAALARTRRARRAQARADGDASSTDWYTIGLGVFVLGGLLFQGTRRLTGTAPQEAPHLGWLVVALLLVLAGPVLRSLLALGPLLAGPAMRQWVLAAPVDRRALLTPRYAAIATATAALGAAVVALAAVVAAPVEPLWWPLTGAAAALVIVAVAVVLQTGRTGAGRIAATGVSAVGAVLAVAALLAPPTTVLPEPSAPVATVVVAVVAVVLLVAGWRRLGRLDRAALGAGSGLAAAAQMAGTFVDYRLLSGLLEQRRWRAARHGRSRPGRGLGPVALVHADLRRAVRTPGAAIYTVGLLLVPYAGSAMLSAAVVAAVSAVAACLVASRVASGLRAVLDSPALRRALGSSDRALIAVHLVAPLVVTTVWTAAALPALLPIQPLAVLLLPVGAVAVMLRSTTRPALDYGAAVFETGFGGVPIDLIRNLLRGPLLLGILVALQLLLAV